jgi:hypothetical protein
MNGSGESGVKNIEIVKENVSVAIGRQQPQHCQSCNSKTENKHYGKHVVTYTRYGQRQLSKKQDTSVVRQKLRK